MTRKRDVGLLLIALAIVLAVWAFGPQPAYPQGPAPAPTDFVTSAWPDAYLPMVTHQGNERREK